MINLRYHIVSLTAVFLAIGIGLTLGSTFLDRATVENLNGQLERLETRLGDREAQLHELQVELQDSEALQDALDAQGTTLLADRLEPVPVVVLAAQGVDEADIAGVVDSLQVAGADVLGLWSLTERLLLGTDADIADLAAMLDETSPDPARLRRLTVDALGAELRARQRLEAEAPDAAEDTDGGEATEDVGEEPVDSGEAGPDETVADPGVAEPPVEAAQESGGLEDLPPGEDLESQDATLSQALTDAGFITFEPVAGGPGSPTLPPGVRLVIVGGSSEVPDDLFVTPLVERLAQGVDEPIDTVVTSAMGDGAAVSEVVSVIRADDRLRSLISTVDGLDHFQGWMATVLAVGDLDDDVVGHYGLGEGATSLLPPLRAT
jgi:hypothetical protein